MADATYSPKTYRTDGGDKLVIASGGTLLVESGATFTVEDGSLEAGDVALADGKILVGNASGVAAGVSMSGNATISNTGAVTIATGAVEDSMIEGLSDGEFIIGTDGTAANNAKVTMSGEATLANDGTLTLAAPAVRALTSQTLAYGDFTDNEDATGYVDFDSDLPAGAIPLGWKAVVGTGFTGDTTAVISVGIAGNLDAFSADTAQSVLAAATVGSSALAAEACAGIGATATPRVTVTGASDFSSISAGSMTVTLYYIDTV